MSSTHESVNFKKALCKFRFGIIFYIPLTLLTYMYLFCLILLYVFHLIYFTFIYHNFNRIPSKSTRVLQKQNNDHTFLQMFIVSTHIPTYIWTIRLNSRAMDHLNTIKYGVQPKTTLSRRRQVFTLKLPLKSWLPTVTAAINGRSRLVATTAS